MLQEGASRPFYSQRSARGLNEFDSNKMSAFPFGEGGFCFMGKE